jgi:hypothetical protein
MTCSKEKIKTKTTEIKTENKKIILTGGLYGRLV